jgi:hypothetical protein
LFWSDPRRSANDRNKLLYLFIPSEEANECVAYRPTDLVLLMEQSESLKSHF